MRGRWLGRALGIVVAAALVCGCGSPTADLPTQPTDAPPTQEAHPQPTTAPPTATATVVPSPTPVPTNTPEPVVLALDVGVPEALRATLEAAATGIALSGGRVLQVVGPESSVQRDALLTAGRLDEMRTLAAEDGAILLRERVYALVAPFETIADGVTMDELLARWRGEGEGPLLAAADVLDGLRASFGSTAGVTPMDDGDDLLALLEETPGALGILPYDALHPRYKVMAVESVSPLGNRFDPAGYPLAVGLAISGEHAPELAEATASLVGEATNRDADRVTELIMTGVTAMTRLTAHRMELHGYTYPAEVISDVLRAADITHVSNEVPFIEGCVVNTTAGNLVMCSDYPYWATLEAIGTDIVGLSGNHVNDFGRQGALESLAFYKERGVPVYGSGRNLEEACAPLFLEHNGNRFAFIAALAFEPQYAWATEDLPGACPYYQEQERIMAMVRELNADPAVDIVAIELQYLETYNPFPTAQQVVEFRELREAGAHLVSGVQSHVPQSWEPYGADDPGGPGMILYGLGNLFFDQMWSWETRTNLIARHTFYEGRLLSTEILTTVLEDYAQPRWATADERAEILNRIHVAAPARP